MTAFPPRCGSKPARVPSVRLMSEDINTQRRRAVAECIGRLTLSWSYLELIVDGCISLTHIYFEGKSLEDRRPKTFSAKLKYLIEGAKEKKQMGFLSPYLPYFEQMSELADYRNWLLHGHLVKINDNQTLQFSRQSIKVKAPKIECKTFVFDEIQKYTQEIHELGVIMHELMDKLLEVTEFVGDSEA